MMYTENKWNYSSWDDKRTLINLIKILEKMMQTQEISNESKSEAGKTIRFAKELLIVKCHKYN